MDREALEGELRDIIQGFLAGRGIDLVDFICRYEGRDLVLRILIDRFEGGVTLGDCAGLNKDIGMVLDEKNILEESYILEVASPGLDRPLKTRNDFSRCRARNVRFFLNQPINGKMELEGIIEKVEDVSLCIDIDGKKVEIPFSNIERAKQVII